GGVVLERGCRDEQVGNRAAVGPAVGELALDVQGPRGDGGGEVEPRQCREAVPAGVVVDAVAGGVEQLEGDDLGHAQRAVGSERFEQPVGGFAVALLLEGGLVGEVPTYRHAPGMISVSPGSS